MRLFNVAALVMLCALLSKILGFFREILLSYFYGASGVSDAYLVSLTIPGVVFAFIGVALSVGFVPVYGRVVRNGGDGNLFVSNLIFFVFLICTFIVSATYFYAEEIVFVFSPGFNSETKDLAVFFTRIFVFGIYASALISIFTGYFNVNGSVLIPVIAGIPFNAVVLLSIFLSSHFGVVYLILGPFFAKIVEIIYFAPYLWRKGFRYVPSFDMGDPGLKSMVFLSAPLLISVSVEQVNVLVDRSIGSTLGEGAISSLSYAHHLNQFILGVFVVSIATICFPRLSRSYNDGNVGEFSKILSEALVAVTFLIVPSAIFFIFFSSDVVSFVYERGAFDSSAVSSTSSALLFYSVGMLGVGVREILSRAFYASHDTKTPVVNSLVGVFLNILLNLILSRYMGVAGLALATSISAMVTAVLLVFALGKKLSVSLSHGFCFKVLKILVGSLFSVVLVCVSGGFLGFGQGAVFFDFFLFCFFYLLAIYFLGLDEFKMLISGGFFGK